MKLTTNYYVWTFDHAYSASHHLKIACINIEHTCTKDNVMSLLTCLLLAVASEGLQSPNLSCCQPIFVLKGKKSVGIRLTTNYH